MTRAGYRIPDKSPGRVNVPQALDLLAWYYGSRDSSRPDVFHVILADGNVGQRFATIAHGRAAARNYKAVKRGGWHPEIIVAQTLAAMTPTQRRRLRRQWQRRGWTARMTRDFARAVKNWNSYKEEVACSDR